MNKVCKNCNKGFSIEEEDLEFYKKVSPVINGERFDLPPPTLCPDCRQQRRLSWRNERCFYNRRCSKTAKKIVSMYPENTIFPVYDSNVWWSDKFNPSEKTPVFEVVE